MTFAPNISIGGSKKISQDLILEKCSSIRIKLVLN